MTLKKETVKETRSSEEQNKEEQSKEQVFADALNERFASMQAQIEKLQKERDAAIKSGGSSPDIEAIVSAAVQAAIKATKQEVSIDDGMDESQIPADDYDEKGVTFYCPLAGYVLTDDRRKGVIVKLPYKKKFIFFDHYATKRQGTGKYEQVAPISRYTSHMRSEQDWIRNHSLYGTMFFEAGSHNITHDDSRFAARAAQIMIVLRTYEINELLQRAREHEMEADPSNLDGLRRNLAIAMVKKEIGEEARIQQHILEETYKSSHLLGRTK